MTLIVCLILSGCAIQPVPQVPKETKVAVTVTPGQDNKLKPCTKQHVPVDDLTPADKKDYQKITDAYDQSVVILRGDRDACATQVDGFLQNPKPPQKQ